MSRTSICPDVVITGIGVVSPLGANIPSFFEALRSGRPGFRSESLSIPGCAEIHEGRFRGGARRVIVVTHGGVLDMIYRFVRGVSLEARRDWELLNASINTVSRSGEAWALEHWGDVAHLETARDDTD